MSLIDPFGRRVNYLRLSVTDRCNLRCSYCMPAEGVAKLEHQDILSYEDLYRITTAAVSLGVEKVRVTGGEPLVRKGLVDFLARLSALPRLKILALTTNGLLLEEMADELLEAGVNRLNISLDSLHPATFAAVTRCGDLNRVQRGIARATRAGIPIKINMVVIRGVNDQEIEQFAALTFDHPYAVRFIEYMPTLAEGNSARLAVSGEEVLARIAARYPLTPLPSDRLAGPARNFRLKGAEGSVGVITPMSNHFCGQCNRIRVTSTGMARNCLFAESSLDLKPVLATGDSAALKVALRSCIAGKSEQHAISWQEASGAGFTMAAIGG
jgi:cyclic pyranopterin phosphate synthase